MSSHEDAPYRPQDAISEGSKGAMILGFIGLTVAALKNTMAKEKRGFLGPFTRSGGTIVHSAVVGGIFGFTRSAAANLREKKDHWNVAIGGFFSGAVIGVRSLRLPQVLGYGAGTAIILTVFSYTGGSLMGYRETQGLDEYERKEMMRLNRRRPIEETIAEIGEGRGIKPPGYEERRRQRLKEKYGVDIKTVSADPGDHERFS